MLAKVIKFVEAEESGKYSLFNSKLFDSVSGVSNFKKQLRDHVKKDDEPPKAPGVHRHCGKKHPYGKCAKSKCQLCDEIGHSKIACEKFKKSQANSKGGKDTKNYAT